MISEIIGDKFSNKRTVLFYDAVSYMTNSYCDVYGKDVVNIYLYGSYARGDYNKYSDMDFAAIVKGERVDLQDKLKIIWSMVAEFNFERDIIISPVVIPYDEFIKFVKNTRDFSREMNWRK